ncbi:hypothetical protein ACHAWF_018713 [Thalassiosira exigua]
MDLKSPLVAFDQRDCSGSKDSDEESDASLLSNSNYQNDGDEMDYLESFKKKKYRPTMHHEKSTVFSGTDEHVKVYELMVGPVLSRGKDLLSEKNIADYINKEGRMDLLWFYSDHKNSFPCSLSNARK